VSYADVGTKRLEQNSPHIPLKSALFKLLEKVPRPKRRFPSMQEQSSDSQAGAAERLFVAVVNQEPNTKKKVSGSNP
jgi:hypothetical protein